MTPPKITTIVMYGCEIKMTATIRKVEPKET